jgi:hypothetical protein
MSKSIALPNSDSFNLQDGD